MGLASPPLTRQTGMGARVPHGCVGFSLSCHVVCVFGPIFGSQTPPPPPSSLLVLAYGWGLAASGAKHKWVLGVGTYECGGRYGPWVCIVVWNAQRNVCEALVVGGDSEWIGLGQGLTRAGVAGAVSCTLSPVTKCEFVGPTKPPQSAEEWVPDVSTSTPQGSATSRHS